MGAAAIAPAGLRQGVSLREFTTWRVGGPAEWFAEPATAEDLLALLRWARDRALEIRTIGAGSNLLISDRGLAGLTLCLRRLQGHELDPSAGVVNAKAGEPLPSLARAVARSGLGGLEWSVGIPGTVGGAVVMNAGAQGGCIAEVLRDVTVIDPGNPDRPCQVLEAAELAYGYRHSRLQEDPRIVVSARFQLEPGLDAGELIRRTSANLQARTSTQPYQQPSCGSVFRNPEPLKAGQLIEALDLKGLRIGAAEVSRLHANFIVNTGGATATDIDALIRTVQERVRQAHGLDLLPEVKRLGPFANDPTGQATMAAGPRP